MSSGAVGQDVHAPGVAHRAAVLGHPVAHSLSPTLHRAAYGQLGLADAWAYGLQDVTAGELPAIVAQLDGGWAGVSLTMPLKQAVLDLLDVVDPLAAAVGAVNTLVVQPGRVGGTGPLVGFNTDVHGIVQTLREAAPARWRPQGAVILGARATASSALAALGELGVTAPVLIGRNFAGPGSATTAASRMGLNALPMPWASPEVVARLLADADVAVSTVPAGVADDVAAALAALLGLDPTVGPAAGLLATPTTGGPLTTPTTGGPLTTPTTGGPLAGRVLLDVVYDPWPSPLVRIWSAAGGLVAPGWGMLLHQADAQVRLMTGHSPDVEVMRSALTAEIDRRRRGGAVGESPVIFPPPVR
ncbi:MAG: shikimate dehydrogenase [Georgenia sp.]